MGAEEMATPATIQEAGEQAEAIVAEEEQSLGSEEDATQETPAEKPPKGDELDQDEEFKKEVAELEKEIGQKLSFGQSKRFRQVYKTKKDLERQLEEAQNRQLTDGELYDLAKERGLLAEEQPAPTTGAQKPTPQGEFTEDTYRQMYMNSTPAQRQWLDFFENINKMRTAPILSKLEAYEQKFGNIETGQLKSRLQQENEDAIKYVKDTYNLDFKKDVEPHINKMLVELRKSVPQDVTLYDAGWSPMRLTKLVLAEQGYKVAEQKAVKKQAEQVSKSKQANAETGDIVQPSGKGSDIGKDISEIMEEEMKAAGLTQFA